MEAGRDREHRWRPEQHERLQEREDESADDGGERQRQRDRAHHGEAAGTRDARRLFEVGWRGGQRGARQDEDDGEGVEAGDVDQTRHREDVDERPLSAGDRPVEHVEEARVRPRQDDVGRGAEEGRRDEGGDRERPDDRLAGHVRPRDEPGHWRADEDAQDADGGRVHERVPDRALVDGLAERLEEVGQREPRPAGDPDGRDQQDGQGRDDEDRDDRGGEEPDRGRGVEPSPQGPAPARRPRRRARHRIRPRTARGTSS